MKIGYSAVEPLISILKGASTDKIKKKTTEALRKLGDERGLEAISSIYIKELSD